MSRIIKTNCRRSVKSVAAVALCISLGAVINAVTVGDINGDGELDSDDVHTIAEHILKNGALSDEQLSAADLTGNSACDAGDLLLAKRFYLNSDSRPECPTDATMSADFAKGNSGYFYKADNWTNGMPFNCTWRASNCVFTDGMMKLSINTDSGELPYSGAEYRTSATYGYGLYEVCMKPIKHSGVVSSFFTYTGPYEGTPWDEIDIEFLGKSTTEVQLNYYTDGVGSHEYMHSLGFDASESFHVYSFMWLEDSITWYVDGVEVHKVTATIPTTPGRIMANVWPGSGVDGWLGAYDGTTPLTAEYLWIAFTAVD